MPQLGETVTEGTIIKWLKNVGDAIAQDEPLFEVSTDKVDSEVPSSAEGVVTEILVPEGATVDIGTRLAVIGEAGAAVPDTDAGAAEAAPEAPAPAPPVEVVAEEAALAAPAPAGAGDEVVADTEAGMEPAATVAEDATPPAGANAAGGLLSPVVRKLVNEHGLDPSAILGTGQGGRVTRGDVLGYLDSKAVGGDGSAGQPAAGAAPPAAAPPAARAGAAAIAPAPTSGLSGDARGFPPAVPGERDEVIPFSNIRRLTADHMVRSKATSAHTLVVVEADYEGVERVRRREKERFKEQ